MLLAKEELISALRGEVRLIVHLLSKVEPAHLDYRPTPGQRSMIELIRYLAIMAPVHLRGALGASFDMDAWRTEWTESQAAASTMGVEEATAAIASQADLAAKLIGDATEEWLSAEFDMFGIRSSRAAKIVSLVLCHYSAYRMQLFLYLKAAGRPELNTINLWVGRDTI